MNTHIPSQNRSSRWLHRTPRLAALLAASLMLSSAAQADTLLSLAADAGITEAPAIEKPTAGATELGSRGSAPYVERCPVYVFQLPNLGTTANPFLTASFTFNFASKNASIRGNALYGLGRRAGDAVLVTDFYSQTATPDPTDATLLEANILDNTTPVGPITTTNEAALVAYLNDQYASGAGAGQYVFLRVNTTSPKTGISYAMVTLSEGGVAGPPDTRPRIDYTAKQGADLTWVGGAGGNAWDVITTANWTNVLEGGGLITFTNGDSVTFDDTSANLAVNLSGTVAPGSITVTNDLNDFTFNGGTIGGAGELIKQGAGTLTLSSVNPAHTGVTAIEGGTLAVSSAASIALAKLTGSGALVKSGAGTLTLSNSSSFTGGVTVQAGTLGLAENTAGTMLSVSSLTFGTGTTGLSINDGVISSSVPLISAPNFTNAGTVAVSYTATTITPGAIVLINYDAATSQLGAFTLAALPLGYSGSLVTNVANSSIDLVITGLPAKIWAGGNSSSAGYSENLWDIASTANWNAGAATFVDGDIVQFDESGSYTDPINVAGFPVAPGLMYVTNSSKTYSFQSGTISTPLLVKDGSGTMSLQVAGNAFTGVDLREGTLSYDATATAAGAFTGDGTLRVGSGAIVTLSGNLAGFDGPITVVSGGTLKLGANNVLGTTNGTTTIANGATLDVNVTQNQTEEIIVSGAGTDFYSGAIINSGAAQQQNALGRVTLTGNTTFGGVSRWDIRSSTTNNATLKMTGAYTLAKEGANIVGLVNVDVDPQLQDINVNGGQFQIEGRTSEALGNVNNTINLAFGTTLGLFNGTAGLLPAWNKKIVLNGDATISKAGAQSAALVGTVNLNSSTLTFNCTAGSLFMSNVLSGSSANVIKIGGSPVTLLGANTYNGLTTVSNGTLTVGSLHTGNGDFVVRPAATLGAVVRQAGTSLTMPKLVLGNELAVDPGVVNVTFDLGAFGNPTVPVINVTGAGLFLPYCASNRFNVLADLNLLNTGSIVLLDYTGSPVTNNIVLGTLPAGVVGTLTHDTANTRFVLNITEVSRAITWVGNVNDQWNIAATQNWLSGTNATDYREIGIGDGVTFNASASNFTVNLTTTLSPKTLAVQGTNDYTFTGTGGLAGSVQLTKAGTGTLYLNTVNNHTNGVFLDDGVVQIGADSAMGAATGRLTYDGGTLRITESLSNTRPFRAQGTVASYTEVLTNKTVLMGGDYGFNNNTAMQHKSGAGTLILTNSGNWRPFVDDGTLILAGNANMTNVGGAMSVGWLTNASAFLKVQDNATLRVTNDFNISDLAGTTGSLRVQDNATLYLTTFFVGKTAGSNTFTLGQVEQTGGLITNTVAGGTAWQVGGNNAASTNSTGSYLLSGGVLDASRNVLIGNFGTGTMEVTGGTMNVRTGTVAVAQTASSTGSLKVTGGVFNQIGAANNLQVGQGGNGTLTVSNTGVVNLGGVLQIGGLSNAVGVVNLGSGGVIASPGVAKVNVDATATLNVNGGTLKATASSATYLQGLNAVNVQSGGLTVDTDGKNITIGQNLQGAGGLTKEGAGTLTMTTPLSAYTGPTLVNGGTLDAQGSFSGSVTVGASGTITPSVGVIGQVQVLGSLTLGGTTVMDIARVALPSYDSFVSGGTLTLGGTLVVTNLGPNALAVGNSFTLFSGALSGNFASVQLPAVDAVSGLNITWNNTLAADGKITVAALGPTIVLDPAPSLTNVVSGGQVQLSWGSEYAGYTLQRQTNSLAVGLSTNWVDLTGTESVTATNYPVNVTVPVEFYRLRYLVP